MQGQKRQNVGRISAKNVVLPWWVMEDIMLTGLDVPCGVKFTHSGEVIIEEERDVIDG